MKETDDLLFHGRSESAPKFQRPDGTLLPGACFQIGSLLYHRLRLDTHWIQEDGGKCTFLSYM